MLNRYCLGQKVHIATRDVVIPLWSPALCKTRWGRGRRGTRWPRWYRWLWMHEIGTGQFVTVVVWYPQVGVKILIIFKLYVACASDLYLVIIVIVT
jgi:hypothetical protein